MLVGLPIATPIPKSLPRPTSVASAGDVMARQAADRPTTDNKRFTTPPRDGPRPAFESHLEGLGKARAAAQANHGERPGVECKVAPVTPPGSNRKRRQQAPFSERSRALPA